MTIRDPVATAGVEIDWTVLPNEHGNRMLWFGAWLVGDQGEEGAWFYSGRGGERSRLVPPPGATGIRIQRWVNDGLDPEYVDLTLDATGTIHAGDLNFDEVQRFSRLPAQF
jgi:hypothetical protein